jgi:hypothetical protein
LLNATNSALFTVNAKNRDHSSVANIVIGIYDRNFHVIPGSTSSGINTTILISDVFIFAFLYVFTARRIAVLGLNHFFIFSYAASINTITVSIHAPKANINEKLVRKFIVNHAKSRKINVIKNDIIIPSVAIKDCLNHINNDVIASTSSIDDIAFDHNDL